MPPKEAAACGRPVVARRAGDLPEWVPEQYLVGETHELIPLIELFMNDRELLIEEGKRFRELSLQWDFKNIVAEYDLMFDAVVK